MSLVISIDPGRIKCGLILVDISQRVVLEGKVVSKDNVVKLISQWQRKNNVQNFYLGNGTSSKYWQKQLRSFNPLELIEEYNTTLLARKRYWELWPPS